MKRNLKNGMSKIVPLALAFTVLLSSNDIYYSTLGSSIVAFQKTHSEEIGEEKEEILEEEIEVVEDSEEVGEIEGIEEDSETTDGEVVEETEDETEETEKTEETEDETEETEEETEDSEIDEETEDLEEGLEELGREENLTSPDDENVRIESRVMTRDYLNTLNISEESKVAVENGAILIDVSEIIKGAGEGFDFQGFIGTSRHKALTLNNPSLHYVLTGSVGKYTDPDYKYYDYSFITLDNETYNITMDNLDLGVWQSKMTAFSIGEGGTVNLNIVNDNYVASHLLISNNAGIEVPETSTLVIEGTGKLRVVGGTAYNNELIGTAGAGIGSGDSRTSGTIIINSGTIVATGGDYEKGGAGIGSGSNGTSGSIIINGGTIQANGGKFIKGKQNATIANMAGGAGIGAGAYGSVGSPIEINGGSVVAVGGASKSSGAGIGGGGEGANDHKVIINAGNIIAIGGGRNEVVSNGGAGIGSGAMNNPSGSDVTSSYIKINSGDIQALGGGLGDTIFSAHGGAGIGGGANRSSGDIEIRNNNGSVQIIAKGGGEGSQHSRGGAGIGSGSTNTAGGAFAKAENISIISSVSGGIIIEATGGGTTESASIATGQGGAGIGSGFGGEASGITIIGATVKALGGGLYSNKYEQGGAGIGSGAQNIARNIIIGSTDASIETKIEAIGVNGAAGIGGGSYGAAESITINSGSIHAEGGKIEGAKGSDIFGGAGIGGGAHGRAFDINILNGTVTAIGGGTSLDNNKSLGGAGIGSGNSADADSITISGGKVTAIGGGTTSQNENAYGGAGIGGGANGAGSNINLVSGDITVTGGGVAKGNSDVYGGAGIGGGYGKEGFNITIDDIKLAAQGGGFAEGSGTVFGGNGIGDGSEISDSNKINPSNVVISDNADIRVYARGNFAIGRNDNLTDLNKNIINAYVAEEISDSDIEINAKLVGSNEVIKNLILPAKNTAFAYNASLGGSYVHSYVLDDEVINLYLVESREDDFIEVNTLEVEVMDTYIARELITRVFYDVTFDVNGGDNAPETQSVMENKFVTVPEEPTKEGYIFTGWIDSDGVQWDFETMVTGDMTLTASWDEIILEKSQAPTINRVFLNDEVITGIGIPNSEIMLGFMSSARTATTVSAISVTNDGTWSTPVPRTLTLRQGDTLRAVQQEIGKEISNAYLRGVISYNTSTVDVIPKVEPPVEIPDEGGVGTPIEIGPGGGGTDEVVLPTEYIPISVDPDNVTAEVGDDGIVYIFDEDGTPLGTMTEEDYLEGNFDNVIPLGTFENDDNAIEVVEDVVAVNVGTKTNPNTDDFSTKPLTGMAIILIGSIAIFINKRKKLI